MQYLAVTLETLMFITLTFLIFVQDADFYFFHRKKQTEVEAELLSAAEGHPDKKDRFFRVLDFNFNQSSGQTPQLENIIRDPSLPEYDRLTVIQRAHIFAQFIDSLLKAKMNDAGKFIHIDHHYNVPALKATSTTVIAVDLINWIHSEETDHEFTEIEKTRILNILSHSIPLLDHSDADIFLSNYCLDRAENPHYLFKYGHIIKGAALFNDYQKDISINASMRQKIRILFLTMLGLEQFAQNELVNYRDSLSAIDAALAYTDSGELDEDVVAKKFKLTANAGLFEKAFLNGYERLLLKYKYFQKLVGNNELIARTSFDFLQPGSVGIFGKLLVLYALENTEEAESSVAVEYLQKYRMVDTDKFKAVLVIAKNPSTQSWFIKIRSLHPTIDLDQFWPVLKKAGLDSGGRSQAGETAYGKFGQPNLSAEKLKEDAQIVISQFNQTFGCARQIAQL